MATPRPRPQAIRLTDAAADRIKYVMANAAQPVVGVRVGVKNGGCAGMAYTMEYAERVEPADEVVEDKGVRVLIDPKAVLFLIGTEMDYKTEKLVRAVRVQQSEPDLGLRLRRIGAAQAGSRGALASPRAFAWLPRISANCSPFSALWTCAACSAVPASSPMARCSRLCMTGSFT